MPHHDAPRRTPFQPRELVEVHRRGDDRENHRDRFDPVNVALAAWTDPVAAPPAPSRPARSGHPAPQQRQPWLPAGGGGRVDPRDVARAAMAAQAAAAATGTEEHPISDQDARPGLISRLAGRVRDARSTDDTRPHPGSSTATDAGSPVEPHSQVEPQSSVGPHSSVEPVETADPTDEVDQEGTWVHHDGSNGHEGWRYHYADGTVVDADGNVLESSDLGAGDDAPAPDAPRRDLDGAASTHEADDDGPVASAAPTRAAATGTGAADHDPADTSGDPARPSGRDAAVGSPQAPASELSHDDASREQDHRSTERRPDDSDETSTQDQADRTPDTPDGDETSKGIDHPTSEDETPRGTEHPAAADEGDGDGDHRPAATAGAVGTALAAGVATAHQSSTDNEDASARDDHADHTDHADQADHHDDPDHDGAAEHQGHEDEARTDEQGTAEESEQPHKADKTESAVPTDEAPDEKASDTSDTDDTGHQDDAKAEPGRTGDEESPSTSGSRTSVPTFVEYSPSEAPRYALGAVAALAAVGAVLIGFSAVAHSSGSDLVLVVVLAVVAAAALWALERWSPTVVTVDDGTLEVSRGSTVDQIDLRDPALDVDLGTDVRSPSWSATFAEPEGSHVTLRRTQVKVGQFVEIVQHHRANLRPPETDEDRG